MHFVHCTSPAEARVTYNSDRPTYLCIFTLLSSLSLSLWNAKFYFIFILSGCFGFDRGKIVCPGEIFSSPRYVWQGEEINVTFTKSILMVRCHLEYWYSRCPHQTTPIQLNWKLGFYRNIQERTKRFFLFKMQEEETWSWQYQLN